MQLKIRRSQRDGGVISKTAIFCLDARVEFTGEEKRHITRYKLGKEVIYNSEAAKRHLEKGDANLGSGAVGNLKALGSFVMARLNLNISIDSLERGQHVECKSLEELMGAEEAIMTACQNLKGYLDLAATFDGREVLFDFATGLAEPVAMAIAPSPALVVDPPALPPPPLPLPAPIVEGLPEPGPEIAANETYDTSGAVDSADYATDYEAVADQPDITIEDGAKRVLMLMAVVIVVFFLLSKMLGN